MAVAKIGDLPYNTLSAAVAAANAMDGATIITLISDIYLVEKLTISGNVIISGAYTINRTAPCVGTLIDINIGGTLTLDGGLIIDGGNKWTIDENEIITPEDGKIISEGFMIVNNGTLNVLNATLQNQYGIGTGSATDGAIKANSNSIVNLEGATIKHFAGEDAGVAVRVGHGSSACSNATLNIKEGTLITDNIAGWNGSIIIAYGTNVINMTGGAITNNIASAASSGTVIMLLNSKMNMSGGEISNNTAKQGRAVYMHSGSQFDMSGTAEIKNNIVGSGALYMRSGATSLTISGNVTIAYNTVNGEYEDLYIPASKKDDVKISGGTYTQDVSEWCSKDYAIMKLPDGTWGVKTTLFQAYVCVDGVIFEADMYVCMNGIIYKVDGIQSRLDLN